MKRFTLFTLFAGLLTLGWLASNDTILRASQTGAGITGEGKMRFRLLFSSTHLPAEAQAKLKGAHGGFAVDRRPGKGETYFSLKGAGLIQISSDLKSVKMIDTDAGMKAVNLHNSTVWYDKSGTPFLTFPSNEANKVYTTDIGGKLLHTLNAPDGKTDLGSPVVNDYFKAGGAFIPTDTEYLDGIIYMTTGYSKLDYVLTAKVTSTKPFKAEWFDLAFGGKGSGVGQFGTGHGITVFPGSTRLDISDRPNSEIDRFTRHGQYLSTLKLPAKSLPCDIYYHDNYAVVGALDGPDKTKGAPVYILENDNLISTLMIKEDLGLPNFSHIHNAVMREVNGKLYVIAQAWNPGDFAILEQVTN